MSKINTFASFMKRSAAVVTAAAAMVFGTSAYAAPSIIGVQSMTSDTQYDLLNREISIAVSLDFPIISITGQPTLSLNVCNIDGAGAVAVYDGWENNEDDIDDATEGCVYFLYTVRPGDTAFNLDATKFSLNGALIDTKGGLCRKSTEMSLPTGTEKPDSLVSDLPGITISTFSYTDGRKTKTGSPMTQLETLQDGVITITRGGAVARDQEFIVECSPAGFISDYQQVFKIPSGSESASFIFTAAKASDTPVTITFKPQVPGYDTAADTYADLTYTIPSIAPGPKAYVFAANNLETYTTTAVALQPFEVVIVRNGSTARDQLFSITVEGTAPRLTKPLSFTIPAGETTGTFTVRADEATSTEFALVITPSGTIGSELRLVVSSVTAGDLPFFISGSADPQNMVIPSLREGEDAEITIARNGDSSEAQSFRVTVESGAGSISVPTTLTIPAGDDTAILPISAVNTASDVKVRLHPNGFGTATTYDLVVTISQISAAAAQKINISKMSEIREDDSSAQITVSLPAAPKAATTVTLTIDPPGKLKFRTGSEYTKTLTFAEGDADPEEITVVPLDGNASVTITATPGGPGAGAYAVTTRDIDVANVNPEIIAPVLMEGTPWVKGGEGSTVLLGWNGRDVAADVADIRVTISWGDGQITEYTGISGTASHIYERPGTWGVTVAMTDKDGGYAAVPGTIEIAPAVSVLVNEYKCRLPVDNSQNSYKGLAGLGRGKIVDPKNPAGTGVITITPEINYQFKFDPSTRDVVFNALPERFTDTLGSFGDAGLEYDSFFYVWLGDSFASPEVLNPAEAPAAAMVKLGEGDTGESKQIGGVFAREHYPEDGCADIDFDALPDDWEKYYFGAGSESSYPYESAAGEYGETGNPDFDFLPANSIDGETVKYPLKGYACYAPNGIPFSNVLEVRGLHHGLNMRKEATLVIGTETKAVVAIETMPAGGVYPDDVTSATTNKFDVGSIPAEYGVAAPGDTNQIDDADESVVYTYVGDEDFNIYQAEECLPIDEPHAGYFESDGTFVETDIRNFFGTDPTNADSDGDGLLDGYEYYWWRVATEIIAGNIESDFEAYDPEKVVEGKPIDPKHVLIAFHPMSAEPVDIEGVDLLDIDGDGLSNYEEMLLGTNPCRWDTDGDGMNDGWEVLWGLNPFDPNDAGDNPDGDYMAYAEDGMTVYRHSDVYKEYGFDPRTAWINVFKERNRQTAGSEPYMRSPNTAKYTSYEEYYLARWCIDRGVVSEVEPMSMVFMTQPVPSGFTRYMANYNQKGNIMLNIAGFTGGTNNYDSVETYPGGLLDPAAKGNQINIPPVAVIFLTEIETHGCDTDGDGMPDGWELYTCCGPDFDPIASALWPTNDKDASFDPDGEGLSNLAECQSTELNEYYTSINSNFVARLDPTWYNKWWPTDPWNSDTDYDCVDDYNEGANFRYTEIEDLQEVYKKFGNNTMLRGHVPGGGLNPNAADTDMDYLPDAFEVQYQGFYREKNEDGSFKWEGGFANQPGCINDSVNGVFYGGGMDGTYFDSISGYDEFSGEQRSFDFDGDGLENYQEYWVNGMYHIQYDKWYAVFAKKGCVADYDSGEYDPNNILDQGQFGMAKKLGVYQTEQGDIVPLQPGSLTYDWSRYADDWQNEGLEGPRVDVFGNPFFPFKYMPPEPRPMLPSYAAADPRLADTDSDNMDDYWEMFHGLNPILSDTFDGVSLWANPAALGYDFRISPWLAGMPNADPDQDDIPNWEEALSPNQPAPANHNTDPSPAWFTDISYPQSFVNLYYNMGSALMYWAPESVMPPYEKFPDPSFMAGDARPSYLFSFEMNEGYDTDNDNLSDKYEIAGASGGVTDPQDTDRPVGRKALYLDGDAAARTRGLCAFGKNTLRSWTVEAWVRPEEPAAGRIQVILERPCAWTDGSPTPNYSNVRRTFRLALDEQGRPYAEFNSGGKNVVTEWAKAPVGNALQPNRWYHLAATMDGFAKKLVLFVDGKRVASKSTSEIPYTGFTYSADNGASSGEYLSPSWAPVVIGASDSNPLGKVDGGHFYYNGGVFKINNQPSLGDFFKGWIDEVRVWTGARPGGEDSGDQRVAKWGWASVKSDFDKLKRYDTADVLASREDTVKQLQRMVSERYSTKSGEVPGTTNGVAGADSRYIMADGLTIEEFYENASSFIYLTGGEDNDIRIPPLLLCDYSFDNLPDPNYESTVPAKFASLNGRPLDYSGQPWWRQAYDRSTVYRTYDDAPYCFPQYIENFVATQPLGALAQNGQDDEEYARISGRAPIPLFSYRPDRTVNSKFWTRYTKGGIAMKDLVDGPGNFDGVGELYENTFPNTANPYGLYYITSNSFKTESHPTIMDQVVYDSVYAVMYNHLLPLRNARADMSVQLWDDPDGTGIGINIDTDGDGLPDYWELANGTDPYNADQNGNGVPDRFDDFDSDGLNNFSEWKAGTDPFNADTNGNGIIDYEDSSDSSAMMNGVAFTDNDYLEDRWEQKWDDRFASTLVYDEHLDRDLDGWDNWSEQLVSDDNYDLAVDVPVPDINLMLTYDKDPSIVFDRATAVPLVAYVYSDRKMAGVPDAVYETTITNDFNVPFTVTLTAADLKSGHVRQGRNWFIVSAFSNNLNFAACGVNDDFIEGTDIGWDRNDVRVALTRDIPGYLRFAWGDTVPGESDAVQHVEVLDVWSRAVFMKDISAARPWLTEADIIDYTDRANNGRNFGLGAADGAMMDGAVFEIRVDGQSVGFYTNKLSALTAPVLISPVNGIVYGARPEFEFRLARESTEFLFELRRGSADGTLLYSGRHLAPGRYNYNNEAYDLVIWQFPYCVGDFMPNGEIFAPGNEAYYWKVTAISPDNDSGIASSVANFRVATSSVMGENGDRGAIRVKVRYPGMAAFANGATPRIRVQAFTTASFNGKPAAELCIAGTNETAVLAGLGIGEYYIRAFVDQDENYLRSNWETWGYYRNENGGTATYAPLAVKTTVLASGPAVTVTLRDADTDNDSIPDALEYVMYKTAKGSVPADDKIWGNSQSWLSFTGPGPVISSPGYTDFDGDGLNDLAELNFGSDPFSADSDGDGISDYLERLLGFSPSVRQTLKITSFESNDDGTVSVDWAWDGLATSATRSSTKPATLASTVTYVIEYTDSLENPEWKVLDTRRSVRTAESAKIQAPPATRFYRIRIYTE